MDVYVIGIYNYDETTIVGVAADVSSAARLLKDKYPEPYIVRWSEPAQANEREWSITGKFSFVPTFSTEHEVDFLISRYPLVS